MILTNNIGIIGGDSRQLYAAEYLSGKGYKCFVYGFMHTTIPPSLKIALNLKEIMSNKIILLPLPVTKNGKTINSPLSQADIPLKDIAEQLTDEHIILYGMAPISTERQIIAKCKNAVDYYKIESFTLKNALLTAEGLVGIILDKLPQSCFKMKIAITGFGRIGSFTAEKLSSLGAEVSIFARNRTQLLRAATSGYNSLNLSALKDNIYRFDCIINTVPSVIIDNNIISNSNKSCVFIEAASAPYGIDFDSCIKNERTLIKAFSLPGKTAPKSAGIIIAETLEECLSEVKIWKNST